MICGAAGERLDDKEGITAQAMERLLSDGALRGETDWQPEWYPGKPGLHGGKRRARGLLTSYLRGVERLTKDN